MSGPGPEHKNCEEVQEHGQDWEVCNDCGAQWDSDGERITMGNGWCLEQCLQEEP